MMQPLEELESNLAAVSPSNKMGTHIPLQQVTTSLVTLGTWFEHFEQQIYQ